MTNINESESMKRKNPMAQKSRTAPLNSMAFFSGSFFMSNQKPKQKNAAQASVIPKYIIKSPAENKKTASTSVGGMFLITVTYLI